MQRETGAARPEGVGSTVEQLLEFVPSAIVGVVREGKILLFAVREDGATFPVMVDLAKIETAIVATSTATVDIDDRSEPGLATAWGIKAETHLHAQSTTNARR